MVQRLDVTIPSGGLECSGWLYLPDGPPAPVVVLAHGMGAVRENWLPAYAERFCAAGYACLVFDYRYLGSSPGIPRQLIDIDAQLADLAAAVAFVRSLDSVDTGRVVLWGTSFGGGHVLTTAARDDRIAAVVAQCPFTDGLASSLWIPIPIAARILGLAIRDIIGARLGAQPVMVALGGYPGSTALMADPRFEAHYQAIKAQAPLFENEVTARITVRSAVHVPGRKAAKIDCPILFCVCDYDTAAPAAATLRHARRARRGEIKRYPIEHFDIYEGDWFERAVTDQIRFLHTHIPPATPGPEHSTPTTEHAAGHPDL